MNKVKNRGLGLIGSSCVAALLANLIAFEVYLEYSTQLNTLSDIVFYLGWLIFAILLVLIGCALFKKKYKLSSHRATELLYITVISTGILLIILAVATYFNYQSRDIENNFRPFFSDLVIDWPALPLIIYANLIALWTGSRYIKIFAALSVSTTSLMIASTILPSPLW